MITFVVWIAFTSSANVRDRCTPSSISFPTRGVAARIRRFSVESRLAATVDGDGYYIRSGIVIVPKGGRIAPGVVV